MGRARPTPTAVSLNLWDASVSSSGIGSIEGGPETWRSSRGSFERGSTMVDRLGTEQKVETESAGPATVADRSAGSPHRDLGAACSAGPRRGPALLAWVPKLGVWAWCFVGAVAATIILVLALGAVSEIVLPLTFAAVLAMIFKPAVGMGQLIMQTQMHRRTT